MRVPGIVSLHKFSWHIWNRDLDMKCWWTAMNCYCCTVHPDCLLILVDSNFIELKIVFVAFSYLAIRNKEITTIFTHAMTAALSWFVQNFIVISLLETELKQNKIHIKSEIGVNTSAWIWKIISTISKEITNTHKFEGEPQFTKWSSKHIFFFQKTVRYINWLWPMGAIWFKESWSTLV